MGHGRCWREDPGQVTFLDQAGGTTWDKTSSPLSLLQQEQRSVFFSRRGVGSRQESATTRASQIRPALWPVVCGPSCASPLGNQNITPPSSSQTVTSFSRTHTQRIATLHPLVTTPPGAGALQALLQHSWVHHLGQPEEIKFSRWSRGRSKPLPLLPPLLYRLFRTLPCTSLPLIHFQTPRPTCPGSQHFRVGRPTDVQFFTFSSI